MKVALLLGVAGLLAARGHSSTPAKRCCEHGFVERRGCVVGDVVLGDVMSMNCSTVFLISDVYVTDKGLFDVDNNILSNDTEEFCVGERLKKSPNHAESSTKIALLCGESDGDIAYIRSSGIIKVFAILSLVSVAFLVLTLSVYLYVSELRDLQGKCIMSQCLCMALGFFHISLMQLDTTTERSIVGSCVGMSYSMYFWMMGMFFWLNVTSINTYRSVIQAAYLSQTAARQFAYYNAYAWGSSAALLLATIVTNEVEGSHIKPRFGVHGQCWFRNSSETWLFFYGPVAVLIAANIVLFVLTSLEIWRSTKNWEVGTINAIKYKFSLYLKIFLVTGISWIFEIASYAHGSYAIIWDMADIFNTLQGAVIFILLIVCRRRALLGLSERGMGGAPVRWLLSRFKKDQENEGILEVETETDNCIRQNNEATFNVNLN